MAKAINNKPKKNLMKVINKQVIKKRPQPKKKAVKPMSGPGHAIFDASTLGVPPSLVPFGKYFPISGLSRTDISPTGISSYIMFFSCVPGTASIGVNVIFQGLVVPAVVPATGVISVPLLSANASSGGASSVKSSKASVEIENTTALLNVQGRVYVANLQQRINLPAAPSTLTAAQWMAVANIVKSYPDTQVLTASHFLERRKFMCSVVDEPDYQNFDAHRGNISLDDFMSHIGVWTGSTERSRPMSTICLVFDTVGSSVTQGNDYNITARAQHLTRWPLDTVPGQHMVSSVATDAKEVNRTRL